MRLKHITFSGADDNTDINRLQTISAKNTCVEWGILLSSKRAGSPRYPSRRWINNVYITSPRYKSPAKFSGHLCGKYVRDLFQGKFTAEEGSISYSDFCIFQRMQVNTGNKFSNANISALENLLRKYHDNYQFILQVNKSNQETFRKLTSNAIKITPLYDQSGGNGITPDCWECTVKNQFCGFAGGLGPDNLAEHLVKLADIVGEQEIWIDMESKLRTQDKFDLDKVETCLEIAAPYF